MAADSVVGLQESCYPHGAGGLLQRLTTYPRKIKSRTQNTDQLSDSFPSCSMLEGNSIDQLMPNIDSVKSVESSLPSCSMLKGDLVDQLMPNVDSVRSVERHLWYFLLSSSRSCIGVKKIRVNESIDYEATSNYGFEDESRKRSLKGNNRKVKKHCDDISITNLFGDQRMESEPEETCLDLPNLSMEQNIQNPIAYLQLSVPLFPTRVPFVDIHNPLTKSPVERKKPANQCVYTPEELDQLDLAGLPEPKTKEQLDEIVRLRQCMNAM
ncbi:hypothetical protein OUZ56_032928 [Daphnia magna]|uniref:Uncharacterized protein n=1 Tax=Daphnia magna TaxID=35525 RepID=A0ABQ9ZXW7_9CRUS|nr:hypothetical protein OUZ56_032928 [Daphnia magna]